MSLAENAEPLFTLFYIHGSGDRSTEPPDSTRIYVPPSDPLLPEGADVATENAESLFRQTVEILRGLGKAKELEDDFPFWPPLDPDATEVEQGADPEDW